MKILRTAAGSMPWLSIADALSKSGIEVIGVDSDRYATGLYKYRGYVVPKADSLKYFEEIVRIIKKEKPDAVMPVLEEEMLVLSKNRATLEKLGARLLLPKDDVVRTCASKRQTYKYFDSIGIPYPKCYDSRIAFPAFVKPNMGRGSANVFKVENQEGLQEALAVVKDPIIQEYVQGDEYSIDVLSDRLGNAVSVVPRKRLATESGISVKGVTVKDGELIDYAKNISKELKLFGPSCIQCIKGRAVNFIEINLRFGGGSILSMHADENVLQNLVRIINDEKTIPAGGFKEGLIMLRHYSERFVSSEEIL